MHPPNTRRITPKSAHTSTGTNIRVQSKFVIEAETLVRMNKLNLANDHANRLTRGGHYQLMQNTDRRLALRQYMTTLQLEDQ